MEVYVSLQCRNFLIAVIFGGIMALSYDILRIVKILLPNIKKIKIKNIIFSFMDVAFFLSFSFITFFMIFYINSGEIRFYIFCGIFLGGIIFHYTLGNFLYKKLRKVILLSKDKIKSSGNKLKNSVKKLIYKKMSFKNRKNDV